MSLESDALDEINKLMKVKPDPYKLVSLCMERAEDLVSEINKAEFLDPDAVAACNRWLAIVSQEIYPVLASPPPPRSWLQRVMGRSRPQPMPGSLDYMLARASGYEYVHTCEELVGLCDKKQIKPELFGEDELRVYNIKNAVIDRVEGLLRCKEVKEALDSCHFRNAMLEKEQAVQNALAVSCSPKIEPVYKVQSLTERGQFYDWDEEAA